MLPSGVITAWYVYGADLSFKVAPDASLTCYHADAQGNIIALTDAATNPVAEYAYTPYGRCLGSTNSQPSTLDSQPFLFVFFGAVVVLTMLAAESFDPRLIWDRSGARSA